MSSYHANGQLSKSRGNGTGKVVKPMLRKLNKSEKSSVDLDRPAAEQDGLGIYDFGASTGSRSAQEVSFNHTRRGYHNRSTSGTSQFSTATSGSGHRTGSFVHPFQQTPRPYTPPISSSYQNSLRESEHDNSNSPVLTEREDEDQIRQHPLRNHSSLSNNHDHRSPSFTGTTQTSNPSSTHPLRIQTKQSSSSRLARTSHTSLSSTLILSPEFASPSETMSPVSAIRTSMEKGFRIRSRSDAQPTSIQEARQLFNEKERAKDERAEMQRLRDQQKQILRDARKSERGHRRSSASDATRRKQSKSDITCQEKGGVFGHDYSNTTMQNPPFISENYPHERRETGLRATKKKTQSSWARLMMWLRTRILRMSSSKKSSRKVLGHEGRHPPQ